MARRKATAGQLVLVGALAVGLGYLLGTWALQLLIGDAPAPQPKLPEVVGAEGEEFSQNVAEAPREQPALERTPEPALESSIPAAEESVTVEELAEEPEPETHWRVVVGNFTTREQLEAAAKVLSEAGFDVLPKGSGPYIIQLGVFQEKERAEALVERLAAFSYPVRVESTTL
jgi:cell division septation protein DedD